MTEIPKRSRRQRRAGAGLPGCPECSLRGVRVGVEHTNHFPSTTDPAVHTCFEAAVEVLTELGASVVEVTLPLFEEVRAALMPIVGAEALAYHWADARARWGDYFEGTRAMLARGALVSGADYVQAQRVRRTAQRQLQHVFQEVDVIVTPAAAVGAFRYGEDDMLDVDRLFSLIFTAYWDAVGNPALVVPMGFTAGLLPLSLQIAGRPFEEALALRVGDAFQQATTWHTALPPLLKQAVAA